MQLILPLLMITALTQVGADTNFVWTSDKEVKCIAFRPEYRFFEGCKGGAIGDPLEAFMRLVAVRGGVTSMLNTRTSLVNFVMVNTETKALEFVRLFSRKETHYLFDDADFLELPKYRVGSLFWYDDESVQNARQAGVPIDNPPFAVSKANGAYRVSRYGIDWQGNVLKLVEMVGTNGTYRILERSIVVRDIQALMPRYE